MAVESKAWKWEMVKDSFEDKWRQPSQESYYLVNRWKALGKQDVLDLGCGIGRHSILFAEEGFRTHAMDLSENAVERAKEWATERHLDIDFKVGDMQHLPYEEESMDALFAYYVISHADTEGVKHILKQIRNVLKPEGEAYLTFGSKDSWGWKENWPVVDANTKLRQEDGPDHNVPHFFADPETIFELMSDFDIIDLKQIQKIEKANGKIKDHHHYHVLAKRR